MSELNASKAREIVDNYCGHCDLKDNSYKDFLSAKAYLQAHALAERVLVKGIERFKIGYAGYMKDEGHFDDLADGINALLKSLFKWRKANGE